MNNVDVVMQTAVIEIDGKQMPVSVGQTCRIDHRHMDPEETILFDKVLALFDTKGSKLGTPYVKNARVTAKVMGQAKGEKIIIFKKKRRKGYRVKNGARQPYTTVTIEAITTN